LILFEWIKNNRGPFFTIIAFLLVMTKTFVDWDSVNKRGEYTVGVIVDVYKKKGANISRYKIVVDEKIFKGRTVNLKGFTEKHIGRKYLVKYEKENVKNNQMLFDYELDSVNIGTIIEGYDTLNIETKFWW